MEDQNQLVELLSVPNWRPHEAVVYPGTVNESVRKNAETIGIRKRSNNHFQADDTFGSGLVSCENLGGTTCSERGHLLGYFGLDCHNFRRTSYCGKSLSRIGAVHGLAPLKKIRKGILPPILTQPRKAKLKRCNARFPHHLTRHCTARRFTYNPHWPFQIRYETQYRQTPSG